MIINRKTLAKSKVDNLKNGYSAFAESQEVAELIEKELVELNMDVHVDRTSIGCWFIPELNSNSDEQLT
ncbi:hypothetical protein IC620_16260 [Hazenella sp. IB182357]|uniref:Uncharacterized protein n=1 Tax=Polycladospora coralii TaxID=2771432 RepID=A0A926NHZ4_9BACL|nr:hypothetical protein [Polycladospora coralii]MBD1373899.1 hypothetical protein [Polycladospora coralii]MBS7529547.1 hypothetical protein [Polycladospora coralii]